MCRDTYMQSYGMMVTSFPIVLGCDAAGVVVEVGSNAQAKFKPGDQVCGCTRLGFPGYSTFQEFVGLAITVCEEMASIRIYSG